MPDGFQKTVALLLGSCKKSLTAQVSYIHNVESLCQKVRYVLLGVRVDLIHLYLLVLGLAVLVTDGLLPGLVPILPVANL